MRSKLYLRDKIIIKGDTIGPSLRSSRRRMLVILELDSFFFFKQKTADEVRLSLVGSEMCLRDRGAHRKQGHM